MKVKRKMFQKSILVFLCAVLVLSGFPLHMNIVQADSPFIENFESYNVGTSPATTGTSSASLPWKKSCCNGLGNGSWTVVADGASNKALQFTHTSATTNVLTYDFFGDISNDITVSTKAKFTGASTGYQAGVVARYKVLVGTTASYYRLYAKNTSASAATLYLEKREGGNNRNLTYSLPSATTATTLSVSNLPITTDYFTLKLEVTNDGNGGVILKGYFNNVLKLQATDAAGSTPAPLMTGQFGLFNYNGNTLFDDVEVIGASAPEVNQPVAPTNLAAVAGDGQASLSWNAVANATSYNLKRGTTSGGPYPDIASVTGTTFTQTGLTNGVTYYYVVSAVNSAGESVQNSNEVSVSPEVPSEPPTAPTNLAAVAGTGQASLTWNTVTGATYYNVKRSEVSGGPYTTIAANVISANYTNTGLVNGTTYYFVVSARNAAGEGLNSSEVSATPVLPAPSAPTGLTATPGNAKVSLSWSSVSGASSYNVKRSTTSGSGYATVATGQTSTNYTDTAVTNGTTYYYVISASNATGEGNNSSQVSALPQDPSNVVPINVSSSSALNSAIASAIPGQKIILADGNYTINKISNKHGTEEAPIIIRAQNNHGAVVTGGSFYIENSSYIVVQGLKYANSGSYGIRMTNNHHVTIKDSHFQLSPNTGSSTWLQIDGANSHHNRVENNLFQNKLDTGKFIVIGGDNPGFTGISQYDVITGNVFRNTLERQTNESEPIRIGESELSFYDSFTTIEHNVFENCDSDPEIISVKSGKNIIRYNVFKSSLGTLSLRHGNGTEIYGNMFFGGNKRVGDNGTGGVRIYGENHKVYNNYFEGLTGDKWDAAITITGGNDDNMTPSKTLNKHYVARNVIIANNTLVNNYSSIELGFENSSGSNVFNLAPQNITFANNIVYASQNQLVKIMREPVNLVWSGNIMYPVGEATLFSGTTATVTSNQINVVNPLLMHVDVNHPLLTKVNISGYKKLAAGSPAINSAINTAAYDTGGYLAFITHDLEQEARTAGSVDVGADEYTGSGSSDTTPPTWSEQPLTYTSTTRSVTLSWNAAADNQGIRAYQILQDNVMINEVFHDTTSYTVNQLEPGTTYSFKVIAADGGGNTVESNVLPASTVAVTSVTLSGIPNQIALTGLSHQLQVTVQYADSTSEVVSTGVTYSSANNKVAISNDGVVTAQSIGADTIQAVYKGVTSAPLSIEVKPSVQVTQITSADTYADGGSSSAYGETKGTLSTIYVKKTGQGRVGYVKFNKPALEGTLDSVQLQLHVSSFDSGVTSVDVELYGITDDSWQEDTLTHNNKPSAQNDVLIGRLKASTTNTVLSYDVTEFVNNQQDEVYSFKIVAFTDNKGVKFVSKEGSDSSKHPALIFTSIVTPTSAPQGLTATAGNSQVELSWQSVDGAASYTILRSTTDGSGYTPIATDITANSYTDSSVINDTAYYYVVTAINVAGASDYSSQATATPTVPVPEQVSALAGTGKVEISWGTVTDATSYNVKRSDVQGGSYTVIASVDVPNYTDISAVNGATYYYVVTAVTQYGESRSSTEISATPIAVPGKVKAKAGKAEIDLRWDAAAGATGYKIKRATEKDGAYSLLTTVIQTSYVDQNVTYGTTYYYVIQAINDSGLGDESTQVEETPKKPSPGNGKHTIDNE